MKYSVKSFKLPMIWSTKSNRRWRVWWVINRVPIPISL